MLQVAGNLDWIEHGSRDLQLLAAARTAGNIKGEDLPQELSPAGQAVFLRIPENIDSLPNNRSDLSKLKNSMIRQLNTS
jgi:hypothetical protein